ncbi:hypothetical protein KKA33_02870 [Patescibacteria group bacterium]|nr:hypothetical protein [Patescibacteria group bacterium]
MFFVSENTEAAEIPSLQGLNPRESALLNLRKICQGLFEDFGSIHMGIALHQLVEKQRNLCLNLGLSVQAVKDVIDDHRNGS